jgi:hypothetical protein
MHRFTSFEVRWKLFLDWNNRAGSWISANMSGPLLDVKDPEAAEFYPLPFSQSWANLVEDRFYDSFNVPWVKVSSCHCDFGNQIGFDHLEWPWRLVFREARLISFVAKYNKSPNIETRLQIDEKLSLVLTLVQQLLNPSARLETRREFAGDIYHFTSLRIAA